MISVLLASVLPLLDEAVFDRNLRLVHPFRQSRVLSYRNRIDRCRSLAAGLLLRKVFLQQGINYDDIKPAEGKHGEPLPCKGLHYSISHAGNYAAVAVADVPVGIDIEAVNRFERGERLAQKFLTQQEYALYGQLGEADKPEMLARAWTRKEAFAKADGRGMSIGFRKVDTLAEEFFRSTKPIEGYMVSIFVETDTTAGGDCLLRSFPENGMIGMEENLYV